MLLKRPSSIKKSMTNGRLQLKKEKNKENLCLSKADKRKNSTMMK